MENSNLTSLADALLQKKAEALRQSGTAKKKKGKDGGPCLLDSFRGYASSVA
jgi:hypothetical protein